MNPSTDRAEASRRPVPGKAPSISSASVAAGIGYRRFPWRRSRRPRPWRRTRRTAKTPATAAGGRGHEERRAEPARRLSGYP